MSVQKTFGIIKPDAVAKNAIGSILASIEKSGLTIAALRKTTLSDADARRFYAVHNERPFFNDLIAFMTEGPVVVMALKGESAISKYREIMGPTDSKKAPAETIRGQHGTDIERNAVHGSDAEETAKAELAFFFTELELS